jgi:hypothetical protein
MHWRTRNLSTVTVPLNIIALVGVGDCGWANPQVDAFQLLSSEKWPSARSVSPAKPLPWLFALIDQSSPFKYLSKSQAFLVTQILTASKSLHILAGE